MSLQNNNEEERARAYLLRLLAYRPRSRAEAIEKLRQKEFSRPVIEAVIGQAEQRGWLNDALFARLWLEDRSLRKPKSRRALARELSAKGIESAQIERAFARVPLDEEALAERLARERLPRYANDDRHRRARKLAGFLQRRGFALNVIYRVLKKIASEDL